MGDFNIAQFIGGIVEGMGKGLTSDKGGGAMNMEVIPKKKNAPPVIEMTPSQEAGQHIQEGAHEALQAPAMSIGTPIASPTAPVAPDMSQMNGMRGGAGEVEVLDRSSWEMGARPAIPMGRRTPPRPRGMRQMRFGGEVQDGETVTVGEAGTELVTKTPDGRVVVTPQEEVIDVNQQVAPNPSGTPAPVSADVMMQMQNPQYSEPESGATVGRSAGDHMTPDLPPNMELPDTVKPGMNDEDGIMNAIQANMEIKPSPWRDLGAALIQAGNNHFNNKNEPIRTWGEIQRDKRVAPLAAKLALVRDAKKARMDAETNAARLGLVNQQIATSKEDDLRQRQNLERLEKKDAATIKNWEEKVDLAKWARIQDDELLAMRDKWKGMDDVNSRRRLDLVEQEVESRNARRAAQTENDGKRLTLDQQKADQLNKHRSSALKIAAARKGSDGSKQSETKILAAETALKKSVAKAVKDGVMDEDEAQDVLSQGVRGYLKSGARPIDQ